LIKANRINNTKHLGDKFEDFCPGAGKNLDCSATGDSIYLTDAFYGISSETPSVCAYT
jgi:hypothetical protein